MAMLNKQKVHVKPPSFPNQNSADFERDMLQVCLMITHVSSIIPHGLAVLGMLPDSPYQSSK